MNPFEEELQKKVEGSEATGADGLDVKAYHEVFKALGREPGYQIPSGFAERVVAQIARKQQSQSSRDYFWFGAGLFFLLMASLATVMFVGFKLDFGFLSVMTDYKGLAVFGIAFIVLLNWLDKRLIKNKQVHN